MSEEYIDKIILYVADALEKEADLGDIQLALLKVQPQKPYVDVELILIAGIQLYWQRKNAPPKKTLIKRLP